MWEAQRAAFFRFGGAWLCLMNSGAALESWGAVFTSLRAQRAGFFFQVNPRPAGGGAKGPPCVFSQIGPEVLGISL